MTSDRFVYVVGRCGCLAWVKVGASTDFGRRLRSIREDRTLTPPAARGRSAHLLVAWPEDDGPAEADLLAQFAEHRWRAPSGHPSEYLDAHAWPVASWLTVTAPAWPSLVTCDWATLRPILGDLAATADTLGVPS